MKKLGNTILAGLLLTAIDKNGSRFSGLRIRHSDIVHGGSLVLELGPAPAQKP
jgi:putative alpha-1,2-mannosidase